MFAYYTAARWFGLVMDCILLIFLITVVITVFVTVKDSSIAGWNNDNYFHVFGFYIFYHYNYIPNEIIIDA